MANPAAELKKQRDALIRENRELDRKLKENNKKIAEIDKVLSQLFALVERNKELFYETTQKVGATRSKDGPKPAIVIDTVRDILSHSTNPMSRGQLLAALGQRGINIGGKNPSNTLGTTLGRASNTFVNLKGYGYWLKFRDYPAANHRSGDSGEEDVSDQ